MCIERQRVPNHPGKALVVAVILFVVTAAIGWTIGALAPQGRQSVGSLPALESLLRANGFNDLVGAVPPALKATDVAGRSVRLTDLRGQLVLINFWGTGCIHCLKEMQPLHELEKAFAARGLVILHICADADDVTIAQATADRIAPGVRALVADTPTGLAPFDLQALPVAWLIGPDGKCIGRSQGARDWSDASLRRLIDQLLPTA